MNDELSDGFWFWLMMIGALVFALVLTWITEDSACGCDDCPVCNKRDEGDTQ